MRFVTASLPGNDRYSLIYRQDSLVEDNKDLIKQLTRVHDVTQEESPQGLRLAVAGREAWLNVPEKVLLEHRTNLEMRLADTRREADIISLRLKNKGYLEKAPESLVNESRRQLEEKQEQIERLVSELGNL